MSVEHLKGIMSVVLFATFASTSRGEQTLIEKNFQIDRGHYPPSYCKFRDAVFDPSEQTFKYLSDSNLHSQCIGVTDIWPIKNVADISTFPGNCDITFDIDHVFTIYYWHGTSNYFHLHYDMLIPLYLAAHHDVKVDFFKQVFMPSVESVRMKVIIRIVILKSYVLPNSAVNALKNIILVNPTVS